MSYMSGVVSDFGGSSSRASSAVREFDRQSLGDSFIDLLDVFNKALFTRTEREKVEVMCDDIIDIAGTVIGGDHEPDLLYEKWDEFVRYIEGTMGRLSTKGLRRRMYIFVISELDGLDRVLQDVMSKVEVMRNRTDIEEIYKRIEADVARARTKAGAEWGSVTQNSLFGIVTALQRDLEYKYSEFFKLAISDVTERASTAGQCVAFAQCIIKAMSGSRRWRVSYVAVDQAIRRVDRVLREALGLGRRDAVRLRGSVAASLAQASVAEVNDVGSTEGDGWRPPDLGKKDGAQSESGDRRRVRIVGKVGGVRRPFAKVERGMESVLREQDRLIAEIDDIREERMIMKQKQEDTYREMSVVLPEYRKRKKMAKQEISNITTALQYLQEDESEVIDGLTERSGKSARGLDEESDVLRERYNDCVTSLKRFNGEASRLARVDGLLGYETECSDTSHSETAHQKSEWSDSSYSESECLSSGKMISPLSTPIRNDPGPFEDDEKEGDCDDMGFYSNEPNRHMSNDSLNNFSGFDVDDAKDIDSETKRALWGQSQPFSLATDGRRLKQVNIDMLAELEQLKQDRKQHKLREKEMLKVSKSVTDDQLLCVFRQTQMHADDLQRAIDTIESDITEEERKIQSIVVREGRVDRTARAEARRSIGERANVVNGNITDIERLLAEDHGRYSEALKYVASVVGPKGESVLRALGSKSPLEVIEVPAQRRKSAGLAKSKQGGRNGAPPPAMTSAPKGAMASFIAAGGPITKRRIMGLQLTHLMDETRENFAALNESRQDVLREIINLETGMKKLAKVEASLQEEERSWLRMSRPSGLKGDRFACAVAAENAWLRQEIKQISSGVEKIISSFDLPSDVDLPDTFSQLRRIIISALNHAHGRLTIKPSEP